jgi:hypothetical protein
VYEDRSPEDPEGVVIERSTEEEAQTNLLAVPQMCAAGRLRCNEKRPGVRRR